MNGGIDPAAHAQMLTGPVIHIAAVGDAELARTPEAATAIGLQSYTIDGREARDKAGFHQAVASEMGFSYGQGDRWDGFSHCLREAALNEGYALLVKNSEQLLAYSSPTELLKMIGILSRRVSEARRRGIPAYALFARSERIRSIALQCGSICDHASAEPQHIYPNEL